MPTPRPTAPMACTAPGVAAPMAAPMAASSGLTSPAAAAPLIAPPTARVAMAGMPAMPPTLNPPDAMDSINGAAFVANAGAASRAPPANAPPTPAVPAISEASLPPLYAHESASAPSPLSAASIAARRSVRPMKSLLIPTARAAASIGANRVAPIEPAPRRMPLAMFREVSDFLAGPRIS